MVEYGTPSLSEERGGTGTTVDMGTHIFLLLAGHELNFDAYITSLATFEVKTHWINIHRVPVRVCEV